MKKWLMAVMFGAVLVLGACGGGDDGASEEPADDVEETENGGETADAGEAEGIFKDNCASCHGGDLEGMSGPKLEDNGLSADEIEDIVEEGPGSMPPELVSGEDLTVLADWLSEQ